MIFRIIFLTAGYAIDVYREGEFGCVASFGFVAMVAALF